jgi:glycosyltransferase involved in cell wall biosynthesis
MRALRSALGQTVPPLEILIVLDSPDPDTRAALANVEPPVRVIELQKVSGAAHARNAGTAAARGDWIALLDDDDQWLPGKLERQLAALEGLGDGDHILSCRVFCRDGEREITLPRQAPKSPSVTTSSSTTPPTVARAWRRPRRCWRRDVSSSACPSIPS